MKAKFNKKYFVLRLMTFPILFALILIKTLYDCVLISVRMLWGGFELVQIYHDRTTIKDIYTKVSELVDNSK